VLRAREMLFMVTNGGSGGIAPSCLTSSLDGLSRQLHATAALTEIGERTLVPTG
jgi:hypothetical protein